MKIPEKIKSGTAINNNRPFPTTFYITLLGLDAILKRYGFQDAVLYKSHNSEEEFDFTLISSGIHFNLFSPYGVGKKIEPLLKDFLKNVILDPEKYTDDIWYQEIVNLVPEIHPIITEANAKKETEWTYKYALTSLACGEDEIEKERLNRLEELTKNYKKAINCKCDFCCEFRSHHFKRDRHIDWIIVDVILTIDKEVNP